MAKSNSISNTGIPKGDRKAVTQYRGFMISEGKKHVTDEQAYCLLLKVREQSAARLAKERSENEAREGERKRENRARAIKDLEQGMSALADVRALLEIMESGRHTPFCVETNALFARATLADVGVKMEQALVDLRVIERRDPGYFLPELEQPEAREAA